MITLKEKVMRVSPLSIDAESCGGVIGCPDWNCYCYLNATKPAYCNREYKEEHCVPCWNREFDFNKAFKCNMDDE